ncbi:MAG: acetylglutamate kinase [Anaerolineae bacterium]|nr:acetylglutamate kinase [Anaerolineae bacterium]
MTSVLKIGGNQLDDPAFIAGMAQIVARMPDLPVIVHGGGKGIKSLQEKLGIEPRYVDGLRVTDAATMEVVAMVLVGQANISLVAALIKAGVQAQGFNGADRWLLRGKKFQHPGADLERVGEVAAVNTTVLKEALGAKVVPVIAPVLLGEDGGFFNANADRAAGAVAAALNADQVTFLTDVPGVLKDGSVITEISRSDVQRLISDGVITGGMAVKLNAALDALSAGVGKAQITNLEGLAQNSGTLVLA